MPMECSGLYQDLIIINKLKCWCKDTTFISFFIIFVAEKLFKNGKSSYNDGFAADDDRQLCSD